VQDIIEIENKHTSGTYAKQPLVIVRGQGASLFDINGVEYLDCSSGHGVANLGHAHPKIAEALYKQASTLVTLFETFPNDQRAALMELGHQMLERVARRPRALFFRQSLDCLDQSQSGFLQRQQFLREQRQWKAGAAGK